MRRFPHAHQITLFLLVLSAVTALVFIANAPAHAYESIQGPTELRYWDTSLAYNGYTLFAASGKTYLIDMSGRLVHTWPIGTNPRLLDNGNLLDAATDDPSGYAGFKELDWDGNVVWQYKETRSTYAPHHDFTRIYNKKLGTYTTLYIANKTVTNEQCLAAGCDPANAPYDGAQMDAVVEVDISGNVVWEWWFFDHVIQDIDATKTNYVGAGKTVADYPGKLNLNLPGHPVRKDWLHCNAMDYNADLGQIVINSVAGEFYVIDHDGTFTAGDPTGSIAKAATSAGDFLYRFGDPARYEQGDPPAILEDWTTSTTGNKQIGGSHHIQWIANGLPGAGHFLVFNNGQYLFERTPQSYIFEINGYLNATKTDTGKYVNPPDAGYYTWKVDSKDTHKQAKLMSNQITWMYYSQNNVSFFSHIGSSAQRLPNGNTLICSDTSGHFFEVTSNGTLVWEYINPVTKDGALKVLPDSLPMSNSVFRAYRYAADHPALKGHDLTPGDPITGPSGTSTSTATATATTPGSTTTPTPTATKGTSTPSPSATPAPSGGKLPDTGQTRDYTSIRGEDSDYTIKPPSFKDNGNGSVTDQVTGLTWQATDGGEMTWANAGTYCQNLTLAGASDWRLPWSWELFSILNHDSVNPALNTTYFPATQAQYWWAAEEQAGDTTKAWAVNAGGGIGPHPKSETISAGGTKRFDARCVRETPSIKGGRFVSNGDGTVTDGTAGLVWQHAASVAPATWEAALPACETLVFAGHDDWRLPNVKELFSLVDETRSKPSVDTAFFPGTASDRYWSSTSNTNATTEAWSVSFDLGIVSHDAKTGAEAVRCVRSGDAAAPTPTPQAPVMVQVTGGQFGMGDHQGYVDPDHPSDEVPIHTVKVNSLYFGKYEITVQQYADFLNSALAQSSIEVRDGNVYGKGGSEIYFTTRVADEYSRIGWDGSKFSVLDNRGNHPVTSVRWFGAAAYTNWLSAQQGLQGCFDLTTGACDFSKNGYRLPTEAEWEYAGRGGQYSPYRIFPWGDDADNTKANWPSSGDPYESGALPWTTPVGFFDGTLRQKADFGWPGSQSSYQTSSGANAYGLYDMSGNAWEWVYDWYGRDYYSISPSDNPTGPATGTLMPDNLPYRGMRGGNWYNGENGHGRVANRNASYYRGPEDPNHPYYHVGFRIVRPVGTNPAPTATPTATPTSTRTPGATPTGTATSAPTQQTVGLFTNDTRAWDSYTLFAPKHYTSTYLIDNEGLLVHKWTGSLYEPGQSAYLLENGDLLRAAMIKGPLSTGGGEGGRVEEFDWAGNLVWELDYSTATEMQHHDIHILPNGNLLMLVVEKRTYAEALAAGFDPAKLDPQIQSQGYMLPDSVVEIRPTLPKGGTVVWRWRVWDHLIQDLDSTKSNYGNVAAHPELIDADGTESRIPAFWNHMNSIDYNATLDQILLSVRGNSEVWIIDHSTTTSQAAGHTGGAHGKGGDLLYRWGNAKAYGAGTQSDQKLYQQHDAEWVPAGYPGAGNITVFNNGLGRNYSTVDEFTPPVDASGNYTLVTGAAFGPSNFAWTYKATPPESLYSEAISGAQRLPNGNTLIDDGVHGTFTEVTTAGEIVWKYINPVVKTGPLAQGEPIPTDPAREGELMNAVFRVYRYGADYAGLVGRDLTPGLPVELYPGKSLYLPTILSREGDDVVMSWAADATDGGYEVWSSDEPYFSPGDPSATPTSLEEPPFRESVGASVARFYTLLGKDQSGEIVCTSARAGAFSFGMTSVNLWQ